MERIPKDITLRALKEAEEGYLERIENIETFLDDIERDAFVLDLKIGNYVIDSNFQICFVTMITGVHGSEQESFMAWPRNGNGTTKTPHWPIPLTEKWFKDFGFTLEKTEDRDWYCINSIYGSFGFSKEENVWIMQEKSMPVQYVHQLQNLVNSLLGINLKLH